MEKLSANDAGRMISALRRLKMVDQKAKRPRDAQWWWRAPRIRRYTDSQIQEFLGLTREEWKEATDAFPLTPAYWTADDYAEKVLTWAKKNGRWPRNNEYKVANDLPGSHPTKYAWRWREGARGFGTLGRDRSDSVYQHIINKPKFWKKMTPELIMAIPNVTDRRTAMEKYGHERLLKKVGTEIQQDDYGKLWSMASDNDVDDRSVWLEVVNSTPEPDGTHAHYFLRVPPNMETAKQAVEWTFPAIADLGVELEVLAQT